MTKKLKILLLTVLGAIALICACFAAGCKFSYTVDEIKEMYGLTAQVTYFLDLSDGEGGKFNDGLFIKNMYYKEGEIPLNLGTMAVGSGSSALNLNAGYNFNGWHVVETDSDGNPKYADGTVYNEADGYDAGKGMSEGELYDFTKPLEKDQHVYVSGGFYEDVKLRFKLLYEDEPFELKVTVKDEAGNDVEKTVPEGELIDGISYNIPKTNGGLSDVTNIMAIEGCTVTGLFVSDDETKDFAERTFTRFTAWPIAYPEPDNNGDYQDVVLYAKVLKGKWTLLRTPDNVKSMFNRNTGNHYYLMNDIDGENAEINNLAAFSGSIYGGKDGRTIKNFIVRNTSELGQGSRASMFGEIRSGAEFKNVTFENMTVRFTVGGTDRRVVDADVSFIANIIQDDVKFTNVSISGNLEIKLSHAENSLITNTTENSWLYGNKDDKTFTEITVPNATCTITNLDGTTVIYRFNNN